jgi:T4 RnlA family RNA ligase
MSAALTIFGESIRDGEFEIDFRRIKVSTSSGFYLFHYNESMTSVPQSEWSELELQSRGIIFNQYGEIVARPFDKFFNYSPSLGYNGRITSVVEKIDGSMGILYRKDGQLVVTSKGSLNSYHGEVATKLLHTKYKATIHNVPLSWTLIFEIVFPQNKIVVNYGETESLVLLGARDYITGDMIDNDVLLEYNNRLWGFELPRRYVFNSCDEIVESCGKMDGRYQEGYVVTFENGLMLKFKAPDYIELHRFKFNMTFARFLDMFISGDIKPDFHDEENQALIDEWRENIESEIDFVMYIAEDFYMRYWKLDRKEYAKASQGIPSNMRRFVFFKYDGVLTREIIVKNLKSVVLQN